MNESIRQFLVRRLTELQVEEKLVSEQLRGIQRERLQFERAFAAINEPRAPDAQAESRQNNRPQRLPDITLKDAALRVLADAPSGLAASEILKEINHRFNANFVRTSLSPQISRLRHEGRVTVIDGKWHLRDRAIQTIERGSQDPEK